MKCMLIPSGECVAPTQEHKEAQAAEEPGQEGVEGEGAHAEHVQKLRAAKLSAWAIDEGCKTWITVMQGPTWMTTVRKA